MSMPHLLGNVVAVLKECVTADPEYAEADAPACAVGCRARREQRELIHATSVNRQILDLALLDGLRDTRFRPPRPEASLSVTVTVSVCCEITSATDIVRFCPTVS